MKTKNLLIIPVIISAMLAISLTGCDDSGTSPETPAEGPKPNIEFRPGSRFIYHYSTISQNGQQHDTTWLTTDVVQNQTMYAGWTCYPIVSTTMDTSTNPPLPIANQTFYVTYDNATYKFYQYGVKKIFDPSQMATWDLVADFSQPIGASIHILTLDSLLGNPNLSADVSSRVVKDTVINTYNPPGIGVNCYKVAIIGDVKLATVTIGNVYLDYYIGYTPPSSPSNPSGRISIKLYPVNISGYPAADGVNQKLYSFTY